LLLPGDRKSIEPMAARVEPGRVQAARQSLHWTYPACAERLCVR
jgi:hypothetical protein